MKEGTTAAAAVAGAAAEKTQPQREQEEKWEPTHVGVEDQAVGRDEEKEAIEEEDKEEGVVDREEEEEEDELMHAALEQIRQQQQEEHEGEQQWAQQQRRVTRSRGEAPPRRRKAHACSSCRDSKTRCDNNFPCGRCYRLCLDCRPQHAPPPEPMGVKEEEKKEGILERQQPKGGRGRAPSAVHSSLVDLAIQSNTPRGMVDGYLKAFHELHLEGVIDRQLVKTLLRMWRGRSLCVGSDISWGIANEVCKMMDFAPTDLELPENMHLDFPAFVRHEKAHLSQSQAALDASESIKLTGQYRRVAEAEQTAACISRIEKDSLCVATNAACRRFFRDTADVLSDIYQRKTLVALIMGALVCPEDRPLWFKGVVQNLFTFKGPYSQLIKMYRRDGQISLYLFHTRNMEVENGARLFTVLLEAAPLSRHVTVNPDEKSVVKRFRVVRPLKEGRSEAGKGPMVSSQSPSHSPSSFFINPFPPPPPSFSTFSPTTALTTSSLRHPGPAAAFSPLAARPLASVPPLAHFPVGLDASTFAAQDEASFAADVLASCSTAIIFPPLQHSSHGALAPAPPPFPPPDFLSVAKVEPVSLAMQEQQQEFARRARKAEMRRRRRRLLKQQQEQKEEGKRVAKESATKQGLRGGNGTRSKRRRRGEGGEAEVGGRTTPPLPNGSQSSSASPFPFEGAAALLPLSPLPSPPPLAPRGGLTARPAGSLLSRRSPINWLGPVPVLDEIPGALAVFEEEKGQGGGVGMEEEEEEEEYEEEEEEEEEKEAEEEEEEMMLV